MSGKHILIWDEEGCDKASADHVEQHVNKNKNFLVRSRSYFVPVQNNNTLFMKYNKWEWL